MPLKTLWLPLTDSFMENLNIPTISQNQRAILESPFLECDIEQAISALQSEKTPNPDGFTCEFYKALLPNLSPLLCVQYCPKYT